MLVAWDNAAVSSPAVIRISPELSPGAFGCSSRFTLSWKDWVSAAIAAGEGGAATGVGLFNTKMSVKTEIARVAMLMILCHFKRHLRRGTNGIRMKGRGLDDGGAATRVLGLSSLGC
jgi:hypothetical protein